MKKAKKVNKPCMMLFVMFGTVIASLVAASLRRALNPGVAEWSDFIIVSCISILAFWAACGVVLLCDARGVFNSTKRKRRCL